MKTQLTHHHESGQILLILTVGIVALLGMVALAVDGGMIFADRRFDQNAADASAFAGAGAAALKIENLKMDSNSFDCSGLFNADKTINLSHPLSEAVVNAIQKADIIAGSNNFKLEYPVINQHGIDINCVSSGKSNYLEVRSVISTTVQTAFAHLFYKGEVRNTVEAVARVNVATAVSGGGVLTHLNTDCNKPLEFGMTNDKKPAWIDGASSNGCIKLEGSKNTIYSPVNEPFDARIPIYYAEKCVNFDKKIEGDNGCPEDNKWTANFEQRGGIVEKYYLEELLKQQENMSRENIQNFWNGICGTTYAGDKNPNFKTGDVIPPGRYTSITIQSGPVEMQSGLYCIETNFRINADLNSHEDGVTIILIEEPGKNPKQGSITVASSANVILTPRRSGADERFDNLLIYAQKYNTSTLRLGGNSSSYFEGTIWAPDGIVHFGGTGSEESSDVQIIADQISIMGSQTLKLHYDVDKIWTLPSNVSLVK
jgi:hypothetical protein